MIKSLTIVYVTARTKPESQWFIDSLHRETGGDYSNTKIIIVNSFLDKPYEVQRRMWDNLTVNYRTVPPKPTIWQGKHRITKVDWWAKCNALNTGICLCDTEWIAFVDDRCVLGVGWLQCIQDAMIHGYAVCGSYEKRANMEVRDGAVVELGELLGHDIRRPRGFPIKTADWYGGSGALPLEWCLIVNGWPEDICDGLGFEDIQFGLLLRNNGFEICYDSRMKLIQDRTPGVAYEGALKRGGKKGLNTPHDDKDFRILDIMKASTTSQNSYVIRALRDQILRGEPWPEPTASHFDWFDGQPIEEME